MNTEKQTFTVPLTTIVTQSTVGHLIRVPIKGSAGEVTISIWSDPTDKPVADGPDSVLLLNAFAVHQGGNRSLNNGNAGKLDIFTSTALATTAFDYEFFTSGDSAGGEQDIDFMTVPTMFDQLVVFAPEIEIQIRADTGADSWTDGKLKVNVTVNSPAVAGRT